MLANGGWDLTLTMLPWTIWRAPTNASKWRMGFNSAFKGLTKLHDSKNRVLDKIRLPHHIDRISGVFDRTKRKPGPFPFECHVSSCELG